MRLETSQMRKLRLKEGLSCLTPYSRFWLSPVITLFQVLQPEVWLWHDPETSKTQRAGTGKPILSALWTVFSFYEKEVWLHLWSRMCCLWGLPGDLAAKNPSAMQETQVWSLGQEDCLEEEMGTHFSIIALRIPRTEEPGGLQSWGSKESDTAETTEHNSAFCGKVLECKPGALHGSWGKLWRHYL